MASVCEVCRKIVAALDRDGMLAPEWLRAAPADPLVSVRNREGFTAERGWSTSQ